MFHSLLILVIIFKKHFIYLFMRETERERERERERQRHRQRERQAPCREPNAGLNPGTPGSRPGLKAGAKLLSHPGVPINFIFFKDFRGIPGWLSGLAPAFSPGRDPGVPGSSLASGSLHGAYFSLCLCLCLFLSVSLMNK